MKTPAFTKTYKGRRVLSMPEFEFEGGRIYAVIGANGSGKSTLAKILAGAAEPDSGRPGLKDVAYMPQKAFAFRMSTRANIMLGGGDRERAEELMRRLGLLQLADKNARRLSGGETARMALARLLMRPCALLILDEPTAAMDMETTAKSEELIKEYCAECGCAVLLITHSLQQAKRTADEILFFRDGELAECGRKDELLSEPKTDRLREFLDFYGN